MKVLKFGGTSVGSPEGLAGIRKIVGSLDGPAVVVVSALGGVTDRLILTAKLAESSDSSYTAYYDALRSRHLELIDSVIREEDREALKAVVTPLLDKLGELFKGVFLLGDLSEHSCDEIVSYGERMSAPIISTMLGCALADSLDMIRTVREDGKDCLASEESYSLVKEKIGGIKEVTVVPGFIARDLHSGRISNLGRGGSDYTASIIAAALEAETLEIWTDVDGFMTADPRMIDTSYVIDELSYEEAMELCNFGAKVVYPPTLYPALSRNIPIRVRNTFNPEGAGTVIKHDCKRSKASITGISSIDDTCLINIGGPIMVGVVGVDKRIFGSLADNHISVFLACQSSSETGISLGVRRRDAEKACEVLNREFAREICEGAVNKATFREGLSTVAVVGDNMNGHPGIAGKLFSTLGRNGINIIAISQGASQTNISFVVESKFLRKSLNVIHDSFFLSEYQELNLFVCGVGTVGAKLLEQIAQQRESLKKEQNLKINIVGIARSTRGIFDRNGIELSNYRELLAAGEPLDIKRLRDEVIGMNIFNSVFVDCTASAEVAGLYEQFFSHGISVVTANKIAASSDYGNYSALKESAKRMGVKFLYETNVGAGLPIIGTINDLRNSGDKIEKIEAVVSGTLNYIFNTISADIPFSKTVKMAQEEGYSEPDPRIDLSGKDVIRKLVILSREAGYKVNQEDVRAELFVPQELFECSLEEFWARLPELDAAFEERRRELEREHKRWRFVACMENGRCSVSLRAVSSDHSFYVLDGSNNIVLLTTSRYHKHPMLIQGYGAGADVTAAGVFADIMRVVNI